MSTAKKKHCLACHVDALVSRGKHTHTHTHTHTCTHTHTHTHAHTHTEHTKDGRGREDACNLDIGVLHPVIQYRPFRRVCKYTCTHTRTQVHAERQGKTHFSNRYIQYCILVWSLKTCTHIPSMQTDQLTKLPGVPSGPSENTCP